MEPALLDSSGWFQQIGGRIHTPKGATFTCSAGREGRMLDYAMVSPHMQAYILVVILFALRKPAAHAPGLLQLGGRHSLA